MLLNHTIFYQDMAKDIWLSCLTCNYLLSNKAALVAHQSRHKEKITQNVDCEFCHLNFQKFSRYCTIWIILNELLQFTWNADFPLYSGGWHVPNQYQPRIVNRKFKDRLK